MTDLLTRPPAPFARAPEPVRRSVSAAGAIAGASAALVSLVLCMAVAVIGWFLADAGAHGNTTDALRIGADGWLMGHGSRAVALGSPLGIAPLGLTLVLVAVTFRCARWAARSAAPVADDKALAKGVAVAVTGYAVVLVVVHAFVATPAAQTSLGRALVGGLLVSALAGGAGFAVGGGRWTAWGVAVPAWGRSIAEGAVAGVLLLVAAGSVVVAVALARSLNDAASLMSSLHLGASDAVMVLGITALLAPNAVLYAMSYLLGPGFAVGTGTLVSTTAVSLGALPAFPPLAALPGNGAPAQWMGALMAVPPLAAAVGAALAQRRYTGVAWDSAALRGFASGLAAGLLVTLLVALSGGPMGTERMADIGAPLAEVLVAAAGGMSIGGMVGGLLMTAVQRHRARR